MLKLNWPLTPFSSYLTPFFSVIKEFKPTKAIIIILILIKVFKTVNIRLHTFNSWSWILFEYCTFLFCFLKTMTVRRFLNILDQHFSIGNLNELNEFQRYVLCRYVLLLYDILLRSWPPYPNLESEFLCHFLGPPMIICFPLFYTYSIQLIFQVKKGQFSLVGFNWLFVRFNWLWVSLNNHLRIWFMFLNHVR